MIGSISFLGAALSCFVMPMLGDIYGRFAVYYLTTWLQLPLFLLALFATELWYIYVVTFGFGFALIGRFTCAFLLISECAIIRDKPFIGTALLTTDILATYYVTFYLRFISQYANSIIWIGFGMNVIACIAGFWTKESPAFLLSIGDRDRAIENMKYIAKFNGIIDYNLTQLLPDPEVGEEDETQKQGEHEAVPQAINTEQDEVVEDKPMAVKDDKKPEAKKKIGFCSNRTIFVNLVIFCIFWSASSFGYYNLTFLMKYIPGNIYINNSVSVTAEVIANLASGYILKAMGVKPAMVIAFISSVTGGVLMICYFHYDNAMAAFVLLSKFGIAFAFNNSYISTPRFFPVALTATAFGICNVFARVATIASPLVAELPLPAPMVAFVVICIIAGFAALFVDEPDLDEEENSKKVEAN